MIGRTFTADEDRSGGAPVALIGAGFWQRKFASSPDVLGKTITLNGTDHTIVGVIPSSYPARAWSSVTPGARRPSTSIPKLILRS